MQHAFRVAALFVLLASSPSYAQLLNPVTPLDGGIPVGSGNPLHVTGSFSASLGGFVPSLSYGTLTATASSSASTALPTNTGTVAFQNQNSAAVSCTLASGSATATTNEIIVPAGSTVFIGTTGYSNAACINQTGSASNVIIMAGGAGLGTGFGGGSGGGGGGGAVFGPTAVGSAAANPPVLLGGTATGGATGNVEVAKVSSGGLVSVDASGATVPVSGTFWPYTLGQQVAGSSVPVVLPAAQITTLTPPSVFPLNATPSLANGNGVVPTQGGSVLSATNGAYFNMLLGNAASATGAGAAGSTTQRTTVSQDSTTMAGASPVLSHASTTALGTSLVAKASAGSLYGFNCTGIAGAAAGFCIAYNGTTAPSTGALTGANVLDFCYFDTSARGCSLSRIPMAVAYGVGIVILISSAASPYTYTTGTDTGAVTVDYQ